jgi:predicted deacylase
VLAGKKPIDNRAVHRVTVGEKADRVRELLSDPDIAAVIDSERVLSRDERRAQRAARNFTSEAAARAKLLEAELREARLAKSPYEATVRILLDLHKGAQVADGVADLAEQLDQPERVADALRALITSATTAPENLSSMIIT